VAHLRCLVCGTTVPHRGAPPHHPLALTTTRIAVVFGWQPVCSALWAPGLDETARGKGDAVRTLGSVAESCGDGSQGHRGVQERCVVAKLRKTPALMGTEQTGVSPGRPQGFPGEFDTVRGA